MKAPDLLRGQAAVSGELGVGEAECLALKGGKVSWLERSTEPGPYALLADLPRGEQLRVELRAPEDDGTRAGLRVVAESRLGTVQVANLSSRVAVPAEVVPASRKGLSVLIPGVEARRRSIEPALTILLGTDCQQDNPDNGREEHSGPTGENEPEATLGS